MDAPLTAEAPTKAARWIGWILTVIITLMLLMSAVMKFTAGEDAAKGFEHLGLPMEVAVPLGSPNW